MRRTRRDAASVKANSSINAVLIRATVCSAVVVGGILIDSVKTPEWYVIAARGLRVQSPDDRPFTTMTSWSLLPAPFV